MEYVLQVPKKYKSSKWNNMRVRIIEEDGAYAITQNQKGKILRFHKKWLIPINM